MNYLLGTILVLFTLASLVFLWKVVKATLSAGTMPKPLLWSGVAIAAAFLFFLNLGFWTSKVQRDRVDENLANTATVLDRLANENKALKPLVTSAPVLIAMGEKLTQADKDMAEVRGEIRGMKSLLTNSITLTASMMREQEGRINQLEHLARTGTVPPPLAGDRAVIQPQVILPPIQTPPPTFTLPELPTIPQVAQAPVAAPSVQPQTAPQPAQPNLREQVEASWKKRTDELAKQAARTKHGLQRVGEVAANAQRTADEAMKAAKAAQQSADMTGNLAVRTSDKVGQNSARINTLEVRVNEQDAAVKRLLKLLENPDVTVPVPPAYQTPTPAPTAAPAPAPTTPAVQSPAQGTQQLALMRGAASENTAPIGDEYSFAVTKTVPVRAWKKVAGVMPYWSEKVAITYEVGATISRTNNEVVARNLVLAIIEQFHKSDGSSFAAKNPADKGVHDELVLAFVEAKKKVLKGNPGWEHLVIHPRYRTSDISNGPVVKTSSTTAGASGNVTASLPRP